MVVNSLLSRPLILSEVSHLLDSLEDVADTSPLTVLELGGQAEIVISFIMSTYSPAYFGFVFERESDTWKTVFKEFYEKEEDTQMGFQNANEAIMAYWHDNSSMKQTDEITTPDDVTFDEYTITDLDEDAYVEYFQ